MNRVAAVGVLVTGLTFGSMAAPQGAVQPRKTQGPGATQPARPPYQGQNTWYEFVLKQFNPDEIDYGSWLEQKRRELIVARLKNPYFFYSLCTTITLLVMIAVCTKLWIDHRRELWITAEMMADIYNQDAYSRQVAHEAIERYNTHMERCTRAIELEEHGEPVSGRDPEIEQLKIDLMRVVSERDTATRERDIAREDVRKKSEILAEMSVRLEALGSKSGTTSNAKATSDVRSADSRLVTHINNLQEQLYAERNSNRRLKGG